ncbi:hypothetical protein [Paenibacillus sp. Aloe-11]|uniref:hypothetical protein n=1 Tax=Paenibacillus sp. Aloe-11 TaxID=1050222 RepID=UPI00024F05F0|nr:hypothetical protein [Paenibacillus sp. Aloe-11]EHS59314.1 hypothetical protein WG8_0828 [Paenibacillus sp. Aloe-11]
MARVKETLEPSFDKTCELIYKLASERINEKFEEWKKSRNFNNVIIDFYPSDRNLFGNVLKCKRTKNNLYLLTPKLVEVVLDKLDFNDENEVYWGNDVDVYLEELFTTVLLEMQAFYDYTKDWMGLPLSTEYEIKGVYRDFILGKDGNFDSLKDDSIDFTYNSYKYFELVNEVGEITDDSVDKKERKDVLTFQELPKKIGTYANEILHPFVSAICLQNLLDSFEKVPNE